MSKYKSPMRIAHRKHIYLDSNDPRAKTDYDLEKYRSRSGAKLIVKESLQSSIDIEEPPTDCLAIGSEYTGSYSVYNHGSRFQFNLIDSEENMIFCGNTSKNYDGSNDPSSGNPSSNITILKLSKDGDFIWQKFIDIDNPGISVNLDIKSAMLDNEDNIYLAGHSGTSINGSDDYLNNFIIKYSKNGTKLWSKKISSEVQGYVTRFEPSNIVFNTNYTNLYIASAREVEYGFSPTDRWFYIYEIDTSSGNLIRSKKYYSTQPYNFYPYYSTTAIDPFSISLCYANNNLYIFGKQSNPRKYIVVLKLSISSFKINDSISLIDPELELPLSTGYLEGLGCYTYNYFDKQTNKIYFAPSFNYNLVFYELNLSSFYISQRHYINNGVVPNGYPGRVISGIYKDSNNDIILSGYSDDYSTTLASSASFLLRYDRIRKKVKYFNYFCITAGTRNIARSFRSDTFYYKFSKILFSTDIVLTTNDNPTLNRGTFAFRIPLNEATYRRDLKINGPQIHSSTRFGMLGYKNISVTSGNFSQEDGEEYLDYDDDTIYSTFSYSENTNDELFTYQITEF